MPAGGFSISTSWHGRRGLSWEANLWEQQTHESTATSRGLEGAAQTPQIVHAGQGKHRNTAQSLIGAFINLAVEGGQDPPQHGEDGGHVGQEGDGGDRAKVEDWAGGGESRWDSGFRSKTGTRGTHWAFEMWQSSPIRGSSSLRSW